MATVGSGKYTYEMHEQWAESALLHCTPSPPPLEGEEVS